ncbi:MAG: nucleoside triphosphate pyrophosphohydrolase [Clostridia bacterium]|nr:nucleoside triphosphate pyrophosphohydrolase [Clostridia bacterium]
MKKLTVIPFSLPGLLSEEARAALTGAEALYLQTAEHPCSRTVLDIRPDAVPLDALYNESPFFEDLNDSIVKALVSDPHEEAAFAVLGRGPGEELGRKLFEAADENGFSVELLPGAGFAEAAVAAAQSLGAVPYFTDRDLRTCFDIRLFSARHPLVVEEVNDRLIAGELKLALGEFYPDVFPIVLMKLDENCRYRAHTVELSSLDHPENAGLFGADTVLILRVPELTERTRCGFDELMEVMRRLRAPGGCPWDAEQTHESLRSSLIEESYEVLDAIDRNDLTALEEELGDLLLQVVFHAVIEEERSEFSMRDVISGIVGKLIYRHPHVFGTVHVADSDEVLVNWENLKQKEKHQQTVADAMAAVPASFPALMRSYKLQKKAAHVGFDWKNAFEALDKVGEEANEVLRAMTDGTPEAVTEEIGDLLFSVVNVARLSKVDPELALQAAADKFMRRFTEMERRILEDGRQLKDMELAEMDEYWDKVKSDE